VTVQPRSNQDVAKRAAGRRAAEEYCKDGMRLGLGSGTTSHWFVRELAERVRDGLDVVGVPTSTATRDLALELGIRLADLNDLPELDVTIDGPDEIDPAGSMIKGGGACLLWEKIVARASKRMVVVADDTKIVDRLGAFPLPIEVLPFGWVSTRRLIGELLAGAGYADVPIERRSGEGGVVVTDSGNYILDAHLGAVGDAGALAVDLNQIPGVVENGLFVGIAREVVVGHPDESAEVVGLPLPEALRRPRHADREQED
jgi:ribose 5-phosphate isomerase A